MGRLIDRGREDRLTSRSPLPPNRACGSPAHGSPVGGSPPRGLTGPRIGGLQGKQPMRDEEGLLASFHADRQRRQHAIRPDRRLGPGPPAPHLSGWRSPLGHSRRGVVRRTGHHASTFLHPFARRALPRVIAPMGALTPARPARRRQWRLYAVLGPDRSPCFTCPAVTTIPPPHTQRPAVAALTRYPSARRLPRIWAGSRLHHWLAGSPGSSGRIEFVILRTGRSPPAAPHPASRRRSCRRLQTGERMPEGDFHPSDKARSQAH